MLDYPIPCNDQARSRAVDELDLMRHEGDPFFEAATAQVRAIFDTPIAFISLFSGDTQTFLARDNVPFEGTPRSHSLCAYTVAARRTIVIPDTHLDPRSREHPIVTEPPHVRFSASAPVILSTGFCIGTLCAIDTSPHPAPTAGQVAMLERTAAMIARFYEVPLEPDPKHAATLRAIGEEAQGEFLNLVGHELRTPLNGVFGLAQMLEPADELQEELIGALLGSAERLNQIVDNVVAFTELGSGEITLDEGEVDLDALARALVAEHAPLARLRGRSIAHASNGPVVVRADSAKLELAMSCLLANAMAHGGPNAVLSVRAAPDGATIRIADDGPGIAPKDEQRIWGAFGVGGGALGRRADGMGLGLPLTRRIVDLHGGELALATDAGGMTSTIHLPRWRCEGPA